MDLNGIIEQFKSAMRAGGIDPPDNIEVDGKLHRFDDASWYVMHGDFPFSGAFGSWRSGLSLKWTFDREGVELTPEQKEELTRQKEANRKKRQSEERQLRTKARINAENIWKSCPQAMAENAYCKRKQIEPLVAREYNGLLAIPVNHKGELVGLQFIAADGSKNFLTGTPLSGSFCLIPGIAGDLSKIVICEGFATGASIHKALRCAVALAFNASNMPLVAEEIRTSYPTAEIIIAADNDQFTERPIKNPGVHHASIALDKILSAGGNPSPQTVSNLLVIPQFKIEDISKEPTDFNDIFCLYGIDELRHQLINGAASFNERSKTLAIDPAYFCGSLPNHPAGKRPLQTVANLAEILRRFGIIIRYNLIKKEQEILIPGLETSIDNGREASLAWVTNICHQFQMSIGSLDGFLTFLADQNHYNPVATWIKSKPWDQKSRLGELFDSVKAVGEDKSPQIHQMKCTLMRRWLISAVAAAFEPCGVAAQGVLVFQGDQYIGKTKWFKALAPAELDVIAEGKILIPNDKDSVKQFIAYWLVELGELDATFKRSDIAQLKAFLTKDRDVIRPAYAKRESSYVRRTVCFASVNPQEFLADPTGNRRFWAIECEAVNWNHGIDMQQIWAEVFDLYAQGEQWHLTADEMKMLKIQNEQFEMTDPIDEKIRARYYWDDLEKTGVWKTATQVLEDVGIDRPTKMDRNRAAAVLRTLNGNLSRRTENGRFLLVGRDRAVPLKSDPSTEYRATIAQYLTQKSDNQESK